jgi:acylphosphatase
MARERVHLRIRGRVQGVFFRARARQRAQALGLSGWVRNCDDGTVEAAAEGETAAVLEFVRWAHQGPPSAEVESVDVQYEPAANDSGNFRILA